MPIHRTEKNNVNRETLVFKAIINQTRSIGNEFLVINIKVQNRRVRHRAVGCAQCRVVLGASRLQDKTNINKRNKVNKNTREPQLQPCSSRWNGNENWTNNNIERRLEKRITRGLYFCLFIHKLTRGTAVAIVVDEGENINKKCGLNFTLKWMNCSPGFSPTSFTLVFQWVSIIL